MRITVITPTIPGRERELERNRAKCKELLQDGDQHIIIFDGPLPHPRTVCEHNELLLQKISRESESGNIQRDYAAMYAVGDCLVYCDDDDILMEDGIKFLHGTPVNKRDTVYLFNMLREDQTYTSFTPDVCGTIGGPQIVPPNRDDIPRWCTKNEYTADFWFIQECIKRFDVQHVGVNICRIKPKW